MEMQTSTSEMLIIGSRSIGEFVDVSIDLEGIVSSIDHLHDYVDMETMAQYSKAMIDPFNNIQSLRVSVASPNGLQFCRCVLLIVKALQDPHNRVRYLELVGRKSYKLDPLIRVLQHTSNSLEKLVLTNFLFDSERIENLSQALQHSNCRVSHLELRDIALQGGEAIRSLMDPVRKGKIKNLKLLGNDMRREEEVMEIACALADPRCRLVQLSLDGNLMDPSALVHLVKSATQVKMLSLNHTMKAIIPALGSALSGLKHLQVLTMEGGTLHDSDISLLPMRSMIRLNLNHNMVLTSNGISTLCSQIRTTCLLQRLHLGEVNLGGDGLRSLGMVLRHCGNQLLWLDVMDSRPAQYTSVTSNASERFFIESLMDPNNRVEELYLSLNHVGSLEILAQTLRSPHSKLKRLGIHSKHKLSREVKEYCSFATAARKSTLRRAQFTRNEHVFLSLDFSYDWFQILVSLLAVTAVPRLGRSCICRILPLGDLATSIADTLGWPLSQAGRIRGLTM